MSSWPPNRFRAAADAAEALGEWEADQLSVDLAATALEYDLAGVG